MKSNKKEIMINNIDLMQFEIFKGNTAHRIKEEGQIRYLINVLQNDSVNYYWEKGEYLYALYILAMIDYLSRLNDVPLCTRYNKYRGYKFENRIYPVSLIMYSKVMNCDIEELIEDAIPEFIKYNIVEGDVFNVA